MKYQKAVVILSVAAMLGFTLSGCGSGKSSSDTASSAETASVSGEASVPEDSSADSLSEPASDTESAESFSEEDSAPPITPTEDNDFDPGFNPQTIIDENFDPTEAEEPFIPDTPDGEGALSFAGEQVKTGAETKTAEIGKEYSVTDTSGNALYSVRIDSMELTDARSDFEEDASNVVIVRYTVTSVSSSDSVYVGALGFRLTDENNKAFRSYELDPETEPGSQISPLSKGETGSFCIAYAVEGSPSSLSLVFGDPDGSGSWQYILPAASDLISGLH